MKKKNLPDVPKLGKIFGPSFILLGLALGSGELILWPFLAASHGLGIIWGALLGITLQFFLNTEIIRYSLAWGESVFVGFKRLWRWWPVWFIFSTFIPWGLPGFSLASAEIFSRIFGFEHTRWLGIALLILTGVILTAGKVLYQTMEYLQRSMILIGMPLILILVVLLTNPIDWSGLARGMVGKGSGYWFLPAGISLGSFLGALAYSGAGGNLNLSQSYNVKEKGLGMGKYADKIVSPWRKEVTKTRLEGKTFDLTPLNLNKFKKWWHLVIKEHLIIFWGLGLIGIILLSVLAKSLVFGQADSHGINFLYQEAGVISQQLLPLAGTLFLIVSGLMLYATQLGVLESSSRIISENFILVGWEEGKKAAPSKWFYFALWGQIGLGIITLLAGIDEPRYILTLSAILNALAMTILFPLIWFLNRRRLDKKLQPGLLRQIIIWVGFLFFAVFSIITLSSFV
jgi:hypothetical protein